MYSLELIDLSANQIRGSIYGLKELQHLRFLNLSGNLDLDLDKVLSDLKDHEFLEQVSFGILNQDDHPLSVNSKKYREKVLVALLPKNRYLKWLDNVSSLFSFDRGI
jgi:hypothetical protein